MNRSDYDKFDELSKALDNQRLSRAFVLFKTLLANSNAGTLPDRLATLQTNYSYLTAYFFVGNDDPGRATVLQQLTAEAYRIYDDLLAAYRLQHISPEEEKLNQFINQHTGIEAQPLKRTFCLFLSATDTALLRNAYDALPQDATDERTAAVTALTLNLLKRFSEEHILFLCELAASSTAAPPAWRALAGILLVLQHYNARMHSFPAITRQIGILAQIQGIQQRVLHICRCMMATALTGDVEHVLSSMQKDILARQKPEENNGTRHVVINLADFEEGNPEWEKSGGNPVSQTIGKHFDAMMQLHNNGADFNYASTKPMLAAPFFRDDITRWFLPFNPAEPGLGINFDTPQGRLVAKLLASNTDACDIDRYAVCLACRSMQTGMEDGFLPEEIRNMSENEIAAAAGKRRGEKNELQDFVRTLFRFFRHNPWDFRHPELSQICMVDALDCLLPHTEHWIELADTCLGMQQYAVAEHIFSQRNSEISVPMFQKRGYALQKMERYEDALGVFNKALRLQDDNWTLSHAADCCHRLGRYDEAIRFYDQLLERQPDRKPFLYAKAQCLLESGRQEEALQIFYRLDFLYPDDISVRRGLGWCAFVCDRDDTAENCFSRLALSPQADANDLLNYAHILFLQRKREEALHYYLRGSELMGDNAEFFRMFCKDKPLLLRKGVPSDALILLEDALPQP